MAQSKEPQAKGLRGSLSIIIVGAGLGGVAAALALGRSGHRVQVFERDAELREIGAGIQLPPNATRMLGQLGVLDEVRRLANEPVEGALRTHDGTVLAQPPQGAVVDKMYRAPYLVMHRADLLRVLVEAATAAGVEVVLGRDVAHVDMAAPSLRDSAGVEYAADLVIGADGERSVCRGALLGRPDPPRASGATVFRIAAKRGDIAEGHPSWELVRQPSVNVWMGRKAHAVSYLLRHDTLNVVLVHGEHPGDELVLGPKAADLTRLRSVFAGWEPAVRELLDVPESQCSQWSLVEIDQLADWGHDDGRFVLIGDAAHAILPYLAQGAAQALEDAGALGAIFAQVASKEDIPRAVDVFKKTRGPRVSRVRQLTLAQKAAYTGDDGPSVQVSDMGKVWNWLWSHDATLEGKKAWDERLSTE